MNNREEEIKRTKEKNKEPEDKKEIICYIEKDEKSLFCGQKIYYIYQETYRNNSWDVFEDNYELITRNICWYCLYLLESPVILGRNINGNIQWWKTCVDDKNIESFIGIYKPNKCYYCDKTIKKLSGICNKCFDTLDLKLFNFDEQILSIPTCIYDNIFTLLLVLHKKTQIPGISVYLPRNIIQLIISFYLL